MGQILGNSWVLSWLDTAPRYTWSLASSARASPENASSSPCFWGGPSSTRRAEPPDAPVALRVPELGARHCGPRVPSLSLALSPFPGEPGQLYLLRRFLASSSVCWWWAKRCWRQSKSAQRHSQFSPLTGKETCPSSEQWGLIRGRRPPGAWLLFRGDLTSGISRGSVFLASAGRRKQSYKKSVEEPRANPSPEEQYTNASSARLSFLGKKPQNKQKTPTNNNSKKNHTLKHLWHSLSRLAESHWNSSKFCISCCKLDRDVLSKWKIHTLCLDVLTNTLVRYN